MFFFFFISKIPKEDYDILQKFDEHVEHCPKNESCSVESCADIRGLLTCWQKCQETGNVNCQICGDVLSTDLITQEVLDLKRMQFQTPSKMILTEIQDYIASKGNKVF